MSVLVLFSGGMDSTIAFYDALYKVQTGRLSGPVHAITFKYGQRHSREIHEAVQIRHRILRSSNYLQFVGQHHILSIENMMPATGSLMTTDSVRKYVGPISDREAEHDPSFIPYRNLLFMTLGTMWARHFNTQTLITGIRGGFPDCTEYFEQQVENIIYTADPSYSMHITSPVHFSRTASLALASTIPECWDALAWTLTCFEGTEPPCGQCLPCTKRAEGFAEFGKSDPLLDRIGRY
jgi:7-cyano-7-deazaguanine synthase